MSTSRKIYYNVVSLEEARRITASLAPQRVTEVVPTRVALNRITADHVLASRNVPHYVASAYDGYAVDASVSYGASESNPRELLTYRAVNTGDPLEPNENCVIPLEDVVEQNGKKLIFKAHAEGNNIRQIGEDAIKGDLLVPALHRLEPMDLALLLAAGVFNVPVIKKPRVIIIPTGDEVVAPETDLEIGNIPETNSVYITEELKDYFDFGVLPPVKNDLEALKSVVDENVGSADIIMTIAGSSYGEKDVTTQFLSASSNGEADILLHGVNIRPGKPLWLARYQGKPFVAMPGFPVSTWAVSNFVLDALLKEYYGFIPHPFHDASALTGRKVPSEGGVVEFVRGVIGKAAEGISVFMPLNRGAGAMSSVVRANAVLAIPANSEGYMEGTKVNLMARYEDWPLLVASDDIALKFLLSELRKHGVFINYVFTGSSTALQLIKRGFAAIAGAHLLCPDGSYNTCMAPEGAIKIPFVKRQQGFMVKKGNPKHVMSVSDLCNPDIVFVNRDKGSGTRVLLDHMLQLEKVDPDLIRGYDHEEVSHLRVAMAVESGVADVGLGIKFAADVVGLDFIPIVEEEYDLFFLPDYASTAEDVRSVMNDAAFRDTIASMGGYTLIRD